MKGLKQARSATKDQFQKDFSDNFLKYKPGVGKTQERSVGKLIWKNQNKQYKKGNNFVGRDKFFFYLYSA